MTGVINIRANGEMIKLDIRKILAFTHTADKTVVTLDDRTELDIAHNTAKILKQSLLDLDFKKSIYIVSDNIVERVYTLYLTATAKTYIAHLTNDQTTEHCVDYMIVSGDPDYLVKKVKADLQDQMKIIKDKKLKVEQEIEQLRNLPEVPMMEDYSFTHKNKTYPGSQLYKIEQYDRYYKLTLIQTHNRNNIFVTIKVSKKTKLGAEIAGWYNNSGGTAWYIPHYFRNTRCIDRDTSIELNQSDFAFKSNGSYFKVVDENNKGLGIYEICEGSHTEDSARKLYLPRKLKEIPEYENDLSILDDDITQLEADYGIIT